MINIRKNIKKSLYLVRFGLSLLKKTMKNNISKLRKKKGITQAKLAKKLGVSEVTLSAYENCRISPNVKIVKILMLELNCKFCELFN